MIDANKSLFSFYEVVEVKGGRPLIAALIGRRGAVLGMAQNEETGAWSYSVQMLDTDEGRNLRESELLPTGLNLTREDFYDGTSIKIVADPRTGEGRFGD